jgi:hypothetical protein
MDVIKMWDFSKQGNLTTLLLGYLLCNLTSEAHQQQYNCVMEAMMEDLAPSTKEMEV